LLAEKHTMQHQLIAWYSKEEKRKRLQISKHGGVMLFFFCKRLTKRISLGNIYIEKRPSSLKFSKTILWFCLNPGPTVKWGPSILNRIRLRTIGCKIRFFPIVEKISCVYFFY
jgi:hypothetical protein